MERKYIAIKVRGINCWLWFEQEKVTRDGIEFTGKEGWGQDGAYLEIVRVKESLIEGVITSDTLQYR